MTFLPAGFNLRLAFWLGLSAGQIACGGAHASSVVVASAEAPSHRSTPVAAPMTSGKQTGGVTVEEILTLVAKRDLWPLGPREAEELLQPLGAVSREVSVPRVLSLSGAPSGAMARFEVAYSRNERGRWIFDGASFFLGEPDLRQLHDTIEQRLTEQLGRPEWTEKSSKFARPLEEPCGCCSLRVRGWGRSC